MCLVTTYKEEIKMELLGIGWKEIVTVVVGVFGMACLWKSYSYFREWRTLGFDIDIIWGVVSFVFGALFITIAIVTFS